MEASMIAWLMARLLPIGAGFAIVVALVAWDHVRIWKAETRGEDRALVNVERNNEKVQQLGQHGASNDGQPVAGSVRDPRYRN